MTLIGDNFFFTHRNIHSHKYWWLEESKLTKTNRQSICYIVYRCVCLRIYQYSQCACYRSSMVCWCMCTPGQCICDDRRLLYVMLCFVRIGKYSERTVRVKRERTFYCLCDNNLLFVRLFGKFVLFRRIEQKRQRWNSRLNKNTQKNITKMCFSFVDEWSTRLPIVVLCAFKLNLK